TEQKNTNYDSGLEEVTDPDRGIPTFDLAQRLLRHSHTFGQLFRRPTLLAARSGNLKAENTDRLFSVGQIGSTHDHDNFAGAYGALCGVRNRFLRWRRRPPSIGGTPRSPNFAPSARSR